MKILCILGKTASGKDYITNMLLASNKNFKKAISYTTRPKRDGEIDGKDYHFISDKEFDLMLKNNEFLESTSYNVNGKIWRYGYAKGSFDKFGVNIVICNPYGFDTLIKSEYKDSISALYLYCNEILRKERYFKRDKNANINDFEARVIQDNKDFENIASLIRRAKLSAIIDTSKTIKKEILKTVKELTK